MKTLKIYLTLACTMFIAISCGSSKTTSIDNRGKSNASISEQSTSKQTISKQPTSEGRTIKETRRTTTTTTDKTTAASKTPSRDINNMQSMYDAVDMDKDQKARYEIDWKSAVDSWTRSNPKQRMNNYERIENQDRILRDILDDSQFERYQQWTIENAQGED